MFLFSTSLHLTAARPLQVMSSSDLTPTAGLGPADTPRKTQGPSGSDAVTQSMSLFPLSQHRPSVSLQCWRVLTRTAGCLSEEINGCLTTLVVIKDMLLYTNIGIWLRDRSYVCNYTSASLRFMPRIVSIAAVFHSDLKALQRLKKQLQQSTKLRASNFIAAPTSGWPHNLECIPSTFFYPGFPTEIVRRISSVKCFELLMENSI